MPKAAGPGSHSERYVDGGPLTHQCTERRIAAPVYSRHDQWQTMTQKGADGNMTSHHDTPTTPDGPFASRPRRFSEGVERIPLAPSSYRVGRFSDGLARSPRSASAKRIGSFADGLVQRPYDRSARRVGSFSDGYERGGRGRETAPRVGSPPNTEEGRFAA
jgi:hypothetical protein